MAKVLVVDDSKVALMGLRRILEDEGYNVITALSGEEALASMDAESPDMVLSDVKMTGIDGYEVCSAIKGTDLPFTIPVVLITALRGKDDKIRGIEVGADDFINKPVDREELIARVESLLRVKFLNDKVVELTQMKEDLTAMIVHDLKHPLTLISGNLQLLEFQQDNFTDKQNHYLKLSLLATEDLNRMIKNLLDVNRMEEGKLELQRESLNLNDIISNEIERLESVVEISHKKISFEPCENLPLLSGDKSIMIRILSNLIDNALKHSPKGKIIIIKTLYDKKENQITVNVIDSGEGVPAEYLDKIFDKFTQVPGSIMKMGRGLGLTFCKLAIEAHSGKIWVESELGKGSAFCCTMPANTTT